MTTYCTCSDSQSMKHTVGCPALKAAYDEVRRLDPIIDAGFKRIAAARKAAGVADGEPLLGLFSDEAEVDG